MGRAAMQPSAVIDVRGLTKDFGGLSAVDGLDLRVEQAEIFGLSGPDGAGKTTTLRMLAGVAAPTSGTGSVLGFDLFSQREDIKKRTGYVSQRFSLYEDLTAEENLDFFSEIYETPLNERADRKRRMLDFSRLLQFRTRLVRDLSGGMKQKLALACAMAHTPSILILDEPTAGVDPVSRRDFWRILYKLAAEGITIVASTAYTDEAARCSRVAVMDRGRILVIGTPAEIADHLTDRASNGSRDHA